MKQMEKILSVLLVAAVIVSAFQAMQIAGVSKTVNSLNDRLEGLESGLVFSGQAPQAQGSQQSSVPSNLQNLPDMVGGC